MEFPNYMYGADGKEAPLIFNDINNKNNSGYLSNESVEMNTYNSLFAPSNSNERMSSDVNSHHDYYANNIYNTTPHFLDDSSGILYNNMTILNTTIQNMALDRITMDDLRKYLIFNIAYNMNRYYLWVVFAFGFPGNTVSFVTILHMKPFTSPTMYVAALALVDNTCLLFKMLFFLLTKYDVALGDTGCGTLLFLGVFTAQLANWLLVAMTVERCLAICLPLKVGSICTKKIHILGLVLMVVCLAGINSQHFVTNKMINNNGDLRCDTNPRYKDFMAVWFWVDGVTYAVLPAALLIVMNTLLIMGIRRSAKIQKQLTNCKASQASEGMRQQRQITIMLVIVCITFVLLITPNAIFYAVRQNWEYRRSASEMARYHFTEQLIFVLCDSTHAINFYLYFFSTKRFRNRCLETAFFCCFTKRRSRSLHGFSGRMTTCSRMSITEVTTVPAGNMVPLRQFSSSSSSSSSASSMGRGGRHVILRNGGERPNRGMKKEPKSVKKFENKHTRYELI